MAPPVTRSGSRNNTEAPEHPSRIGSESPTSTPGEEPRETQTQRNSPEPNDEPLEENHRFVNETIRRLEL